jgi:hypothetical protein
MRKLARYRALACMVQCPNPDCNTEVRFSIDETLWSVPQTNAVRFVDALNDNNRGWIRCEKCKTLVFLCQRAHTTLDEFEMAKI